MFIMFNLCLIFFMGSLWMKGTLRGKPGYVKTAYNKSWKEWLAENWGIIL